MDMDSKKVSSLLFWFIFWLQMQVFIREFTLFIFQNTPRKFSNFHRLFIIRENHQIFDSNRNNRLEFKLSNLLYVVSCIDLIGH